MHRYSRSMTVYNRKGVGGMKYFFIHLRSNYSPTFILGIFCLFFILSIFSFAPTKASAQTPGQVPVFDAVGNATLEAQLGVQSTQLAINKQLVLKEFTLDGIVFTLINMIISALSESITNWINSDFQGQPQFMSDPTGFFLTIGNEMTGYFIEEGGLADLLCGNFQLPFLSLALNFNFTANFGLPRARYNCTLFDVANNVLNMADFVEGSFSNANGRGGWSNWIALTNSQSNMYSGYVAASITLDKRIANMAGIENSKLSWGKGFKSIEDGVTGIIRTPGSVLETQLNNSLDSENRRLQVADEISEMIGALAGFAMRKLVNGLGSSGSAGSARYSINGIDPNTYQDQINNRNQSIADDVDAGNEGDYFFEGDEVPINVEYLQNTGGSQSRSVYIQSIGFSNTTGQEDRKPSNLVNTLTDDAGKITSLNNQTYADFILSEQTNIETIQFFTATIDERKTAPTNATLYYKTSDGGSPIPIPAPTCSISTDSTLPVNKASGPTCGFTRTPGTSAPGVITVSLNVPVNAKSIFVDMGGQGEVALAEVKVTRRIVPVFDSIASASIKAGSAPFNILTGVSAKDSDGQTLTGPNIVATISSPSGEIVPSINTSVTGSWTIRYTATDNKGLVSGTISRTITVTP